MSIPTEQDDEEEGESAKPAKNKTSDFLLAEYTNLSQAHFTTNSSVSTFFRSYLVLIGLPIPLIGFALSQVGQSKQLNVFVEVFSYLIPIGAFVLGCVGYFVMIYVINLRLDSLLYARAVNGIRKHFMNTSGLSFEQEHRIRVMPRSSFQPRYHEWHYTFSVICVFAIINTVYFAISCYWYFAFAPKTSDRWTIPAMIAAVASSMLIHAATYNLLVWYRETKYLRSHTIGTDIDGVLNDHRPQFCKLLNELCDKELLPDAITSIPVHEASLGVTEADEGSIFNHPRYWTEMPAAPAVGPMLSRIRNVLGYKVVVFTHRPWPEPKSFPTGQESNYRKLWKKSFFHCFSRGFSVNSLTKAWLSQHNIPYDKLVIERGNIHTADPRTLTMNRFIYSERHKVRVFVEDDLLKAIKLADICEVVFLIDHPYNQKADLPSNIIRIKSGWPEIYQWMKKLF